MPDSQIHPKSPRVLVAVNTASQLLGKSVNALTAFIITIIIARTYGAAGFGDFTKITTFVALFYLAVDFGLNAVYQTEAGKSENSRRLWGALLTLRIMLSLILVFITISLSVFLPATALGGFTPVVKLGIILYSLTIVTQAIITSTNAVFQQTLRYDLSTVATTVGAVVSLSLVFIFSQTLLPRLGTLSSILAILTGAALAAVTGLWLVTRLTTATLIFDRQIIKGLLSKSWPLAATLIFNVIYFRADTLILTLFRSTTEVGLYGMAYKIFEFVLVIPTFFLNSLFPLMVKARSESHPSHFWRIFRKSFIILLITSIALSVLGVILSPYLSFIGGEFFQSQSVFRILVLGLPFFFVSSLTMWTLILYEKRLQLCIIYFASMLINIGTNLIFIPRYGMAAAAIITVASEVLVLTLTGIACIKTFKHQAEVK